jgi:hypothetical protein
LTDETVETVLLDVVELTDRAGECERTEEVSETDPPERPVGSCRKRLPLPEAMMEDLLTFDFWNERRVLVRVMFF